MMPNKRPEDRARFHREYTRQTFRDIIPTEDDVSKCISKDKGGMISEGVFDLWAADFRRWLKEYESSIRHKRALAGANALKRKRQKDGKAKKT
jgi:hypothetical protein